MAGNFVKVYVKKTVRYNELSFSQQQMLRIGTVGVAAVKNRVELGQGPNDGPAKPLTPGYAKYKSRHGLKPLRDLVGNGVMYLQGIKRKSPRYAQVGHMLDN